jgi:hypothetical protein
VYGRESTDSSEGHQQMLVTFVTGRGAVHTVNYA